MSMKYWAEQLYGIYLLPEDLQPYFDKHAEDYASIEDLADDIGCSTHSGMMNGTYVPVKPDAAHDYMDGDEYFFFLDLGEYPSLFKAQYASYEEALEELKEPLQKYLPEDFDYEKRFVVYYGVSIG